MTADQKANIDSLRDGLRDARKRYVEAITSIDMRLKVIEALDKMPLAERYAFAFDVAEGYESLLPEDE